MPKTAHTRTADRLIRSRGPVPKQQQAGRPGPPRKFTAYTVAQLLETYRDPRAVLLEIALLTPKAREDLACSMADAMAERRLCAQAVLPYVAQKLPVQVDMRHTRAIHLNIVDDRQYQDLVTSRQLQMTPTPSAWPCCPTAQAMTLQGAKGMSRPPRQPLLQRSASLQRGWRAQASGTQG